MPAKYLTIKQKFLREGMAQAEAKRRAAKIYNAARKPGTKPVTAAYD